MMNGLRERPTFESLARIIEEDKDKLKYPKRKAKQFSDSFVFSNMIQNAQHNNVASQAIEKVLTKLIADKHGVDEGELTEAFKAFNLKPRFRNMGVGTDAPIHFSTSLSGDSDDDISDAIFESIPGEVEQDEELLDTEEKEHSKIRRSMRGNSGYGPIDENDRGLKKWFMRIFKTPYTRHEDIDIIYTPKEKKIRPEIDDLPTGQDEREREFMEESERKRREKKRD